jgi:hypothetical protein
MLLFREWNEAEFPNHSILCTISFGNFEDSFPKQPLLSDRNLAIHQTRQQQVTGGLVATI